MVEKAEKSKLTEKYLNEISMTGLTVLSKNVDFKHEKN
jgi:hypothetical protein